MRILAAPLRALLSYFDLCLMSARWLSKFFGAQLRQVTNQVFLW